MTRAPRYGYFTRPTRSLGRGQTRVVGALLLQARDDPEALGVALIRTRVGGRSQLLEGLAPELPPTSPSKSASTSSRYGRTVDGQGREPKHAASPKLSLTRKVFASARPICATSIEWVTQRRFNQEAPDAVRKRQNSSPRAGLRRVERPETRITSEVAERPFPRPLFHEPVPRTGRGTGSRRSAYLTPVAGCADPVATRPAEAHLGLSHASLLRSGCACLLRRERRELRELRSVRELQGRVRGFLLRN